jgi:TonB family protein
MHELVSDILTERARLDAGGLGRTLPYSIAVHAVLLVALVLMPREWQHPVDQERTIMTISLGGTPGPRTGGMTAIGGRAVQEVAPPQARPTPPSPPAPKPPEMVLPQQKPAARTTPPPRVTKPVDQARARRPAFGTEIQEGNARVETGATGNNFGLTTGGGSGAGGYLDVGNFCCPEYLQTMLQLIQKNWNGQQAVSGQSQVKFTIQRDGTLTAIELERPSGYFALDRAAQRAVLVTGRLPPLPRQFTEGHLTVHLIFRYQR